MLFSETITINGVIIVSFLKIMNSTNATSQFSLAISRSVPCLESRRHDSFITDNYPPPKSDVLRKQLNKQTKKKYNIDDRLKRECVEASLDMKNKVHTMKQFE